MATGLFFSLIKGKFSSRVLPDRNPPSHWMVPQFRSKKRVIDANFWLNGSLRRITRISPRRS
jgi:hypothetical protein